MRCVAFIFISHTGIRTYNDSSMNKKLALPLIFESSAWQHQSKMLRFNPLYSSHHRFNKCIPFQIFDRFNSILFRILNYYSMLCCPQQRVYKFNLRTKMNDVRRWDEERWFEFSCNMHINGENLIIHSLENASMTKVCRVCSFSPFPFLIRFVCHFWHDSIGKLQ